MNLNRHNNIYPANNPVTHQLTVYWTGAKLDYVRYILRMIKWKMKLQKIAVKGRGSMLVPVRFAAAYGYTCQIYVPLGAHLMSILISSMTHLSTRGLFSPLLQHWPPQSGPNSTWGGPVHLSLMHVSLSPCGAPWIRITLKCPRYCDNYNILFFWVGKENCCRRKNAIVIMCS